MPSAKPTGVVNALAEWTEATRPVTAERKSACSAPDIRAGETAGHTDPPAAANHSW